MQENKAFDHWAIVEIFGHKTYAGRVTEQTIGGSSFVRIDVPQTSKTDAFTKMFGQNAIYGITIVDEATAKLKAESVQQTPMTEWEINNLVREQVNKQLEGMKLINGPQYADGEQYC